MDFAWEPQRSNGLLPCFRVAHPKDGTCAPSFIGGATDPGIAGLDSEQIAQAVHQDLCKVLLQHDVLPKVLAVHLWKRAIPQYTLGHRKRLEKLNQGLQQLPGLYLCSNYIDGVALGDCVQRAQLRAAEIDAYLTASAKAP